MERAGETELLYDSGAALRVERAGDCVRIVLRTNERESRDYHALTLNEDLTGGDAVYDGSVFGDDVAPYPLADPLHEIWTSFLLMRRRGLLVHGCGVLVGEEAHLFLGRSGAGKSTMAGLLEQRGAGLILSDDRLILRPEGGGFRVFGTPWRGVPEYASARSGRLASVAFLEQDTASRRNRLDADVAATRLFDACYVVGWPRRGIAFVLEMAAEVARRVPCYRLRFRPDATAVEAAAVLEVAG